MNRAWLLLTLDAEDRQYVGNEGYDDELEQVYRYDSRVANCRRLSPGDLVLIRNRHQLLGGAQIDRIESRSGTKRVFRCPVCDVTALRRRKNVEPAFRCTAGHQFSAPRVQEAECELFAAHYGGTFHPVRSPVPVTSVRAAILKPNDQHSVHELDLLQALNLLGDAIPGLSARWLAAALSDQADPGSETADKSPWSGSPDLLVIDERRRLLREIAVRRGQTSFRRRLIENYGGRCCITGCAVVDILEAAHISPYRNDSHNQPGNGLLLRADLHTLFDLNRLAIHPETRMIRTAPPLRGSEYADLDGTPMRPPTAAPPRHDALRERWAIFGRLWPEVVDTDRSLVLTA